MFGRVSQPSLTCLVGQLTRTYDALIKVGPHSPQSSYRHNRSSSCNKCTRHHLAFCGSQSGPSVKLHGNHRGTRRSPLIGVLSPAHFDSGSVQYTTFYSKQNRYERARIMCSSTASYRDCFWVSVPKTDLGVQQLSYR